MSLELYATGGEGVRPTVDRRRGGVETNFAIDEALLRECLRNVSPQSDIAIRTYAIGRERGVPGTTGTSQTFCVTVEYDRDGRPLQEFLVLKVPFLNVHYEVFETIGLYDKERYVYGAVLPRMLEISSWLRVAPAHFHTTASGVLALQNVRTQGYCRHHRAMLDFERSGRVLATVSAFHATSVKLAQERADVLAPALFRGDVYDRRLIGELMDATVPVLLVALQRANVASVLLDNFAAYPERIRRGGLCRIAERACDFNVLNHGDVKRNNIFFKNDDAGKPVSVKLLDYQVCHWNSPVFDILYFVITSVHFSVFEKRGDDLVNGYLAALNNTLTRLECRCTYTRNQFNADMEGCKLFQVTTLILVGFYVIKETVDGFDAEKNDSWGEMEIDELCENVKFKCWFLKWFWYFVERGYFD